VAKRAGRCVAESLPLHRGKDDALLVVEGRGMYRMEVAGVR
jgi:hypothetical protein